MRNATLQSGLRPGKTLCTQELEVSPLGLTRTPGMSRKNFRTTEALSRFDLTVYWVRQVNEFAG